MARRSPARGPRARFFGAVVTATDLLPPRIRYGYVHRMSRALFAHPLPSLPRTVSRAVTDGVEQTTRSSDLSCAILADHLDVGGIGSVVEMLATGLSAEGVRPIVVCHGDGVRAERLRTLGVEVLAVTDAATAREALARAGADVLQLHSAPAYLEAAAMASGSPLVTVMHNTEIHYTAAKWDAYRTLLRHSTAGIAVSETVRDYHARRLPAELAARLDVVPNGAAPLAVATVDDRLAARTALAAALGVPDDLGVLFVSLARYDSQKNVAGAAVAFARAATRRDDIRLVFAGDPSDWAELRRAEALSARGPAAGRIHFLGNSDAVTLLTAADAFLLDSFFEGWPVAATEAAAAGLPLVVSEMGGARELVSRDPGFSIMTPNPAGDASGISDASVRRARRRTAAQQGGAELEAAVLTVAGRVADLTTPLAPRSPFTAAEMVSGHARVLREAVGSG